MKNLALAILRLGIVASLISPLSAELILSGSLYTQSFNSLGLGLPANWTIQTGANANSLGTTATLTTVNSNWGNTVAGFKNMASTNNLPFDASATSQSTSNDRMLGVRITEAFGDPGAAFTLEIANTVGFQNFNLSFEAHLADEEGRTTEWTVRWGSGASPTSFTTLGSFSPSTFGSTTPSFALDSTFANSNEKKWIQIVTLSSSSGSGSRDTFGIDDFALTFSAVPEPSSLLLAGLGSIFALKSRRRIIH